MTVPGVGWPRRTAVSRAQGRRRYAAFATVVVVAVVTLAAPARAQVSAQSLPATIDPTPSVSMWYRGEPAGTPRLDDLAELRALGFTGVTWPASLPAGVTAVRRLATQAGLRVEVRAPQPVWTPGSAIPADGTVDLSVAESAAAAMPATAWRAIARGARHLHFTAGEAAGQGWRDAAGAMRPWLADARVIARQLEFNADLVRAFGRTMAMTIEGDPPPGVEVLLVDANQSWVVIATNVMPAVARGAARLPRGVPPAPWANLFDGEVVAMLDQPAGPRWTFTLPPGAGLVLAIDKR